MADDDLSRSSPSRLWRTVLVLSLALNLAVLGMVVGAGFSGRFSDHAPRSFDFGLGPVARALDPSERRAVGSVMRRDDALRSVDLRGNTSEMIAALRADPFDPARLETLMADQMVQTAVIQRSAQQALLMEITDMSPERRANFADRLDEELMRRRDRRSGG